MHLPQGCRATLWGANAMNGVINIITRPAYLTTVSWALVADDNRDAADTLGLLLEMSGYAVIVAHSGGEAIARAKAAGFDEHLTNPVDPDRVEILRDYHSRRGPAGRTPL